MSPVPVPVPLFAADDAGAVAYARVPGTPTLTLPTDVWRDRRGAWRPGSEKCWPPCTPPR
jgi:hypothetical protein